MIPNRSPWIHQLDKERVVTSIDKDLETDVAIVGGGIAGVSTAFFILKNTDKRVVLLEGGRLGHGATGHNAGQITAYLARSLQDLSNEFGLEMAVSAQRAIEETAWELLNKMYTEARLDIPLSRFTGHLGISSKEHLLSLLKDNVVRGRGDLPLKEVRVREGVPFIEELEEFKGLYKLAKREEIMELLETRSGEFIACLSEPKGCTNSALFTEEIASYLLEEFKDRFFVYEQTHISKIVLHDDHALLDAGKQTVRAVRVVLCTNGFDNITIFNKTGLDIDTRFHHSVEGVIGYMSGYLDETSKPPTAISYFLEGDELSGDESSGEPYVYMTRRAYEYNEGKHSLISIGGPDVNIENRSEYEKDHEYPDWAKDEIDKFVRKFLTDRGEIDYIFTWHGLMGYTRNKLRLVGVEPKNKVLLYNLGCNGVGILPSVYGGDRISKIINGEKLPDSIFDPK